MNMENIGLKYKYLFACICLLGAFLCGYNFNERYLARHMVKKYISIIYSYSKNNLGYGRFEELLQEEFRKQGIDAVFDRYYVGADDNNLQDETERVRSYLELIKNKPIDLIMPVGDQSTSSLLATRHRLLYSIPVVACNVHFPDEKLIREYESSKVYILRDAPDFRKNIDFIRGLQDNANIEILYNVDFTNLGHKSFDLLTHTVDRRYVRVLSSESSFPIEYEYKELKEMVEYYTLMPAVAREELKKNKLTVSLCPFRYMKGAPLLVMMQKSEEEQGRKAFLLDKFDLVSLPIANALNIPSFSCLREGFGEDAKIVGGYMATDEISARAAADISLALLNKEKIGMPQVRDLEKEYVLDWTYFSAYSDYKIKNVPANVHIINYPFYDRYREELYLVFVIFVVAFILISFILLHTRRRVVIERRNMKMLEEAHKRLTLSADGGRISLWNIQGDEVEFDENYSNLTGLRQRRFTKEDFMKYVYPDDYQLFSSFCDALFHLTDMRMQRARFCFSGDGVYQWYEFRCRSLKDTSGKVILAGIMQNIQEMVEHENQLIIAKHMAENAELKQSFLNNMSHEIRTPLNAIVGFTNLLVGEGADEIDPEERADMLNIINHNNELLLKLINDMVEISRLDSGNVDFELKACDLVALLKEIYNTQRPLMQPSLDFILDLDESDSPLVVNIDCLRFSQVINNFLNNANKFTRSGHITLGCAVNKEHSEVRVYVEDTGKGIDEKELMMIFDRFYKADIFEQGSGLGLPISKVIVERLSGRIEVRSEVGKGSCFAVILPLGCG